MSGSSVSRSWRARMPSTLTMVSKPRTARLDRIRSTMLGSSSTTRAQVLREPSVIVTVAVPSARGGRVRGGLVTSADAVRSSQRPGQPARVDLGLDGQVDAEAGALGPRGQLDPAAVGRYDPLRDGQAQAGAGALVVTVTGAGAGAGAVAGAVLVA